MRLFVDKLVEYSEVPLDISLFYEEDPEASLLAGEADLIYVDSAGLIPYDSDFAIYASPFYFRDYEHMTMTLNSPTFIQLTELDYAETLKARQLGVFYGGHHDGDDQGEPHPCGEGYAGVHTGRAI